MRGKKIEDIFAREEKCYYLEDVDDNLMKQILNKNEGKVVGYIRSGDTESTLSQRNIIVDFCKKLNVKCNEFYTDVGYSGRNMDRPGVKKIAQLNESKVILTSSISRFSRSMIGMERYIYEENKIIIGIYEKVIISNDARLAKC